MIISQIDSTLHQAVQHGMKQLVAFSHPSSRSQPSETVVKMIKATIYSLSILLVRKMGWDIYYWLRSSPPGPRGSSFPLFGDFVAFGLSPVSWLLTAPNDYKQHGPCNEVMCIPMGIASKIYINNSKIARELTKSKLIDNRPNTFTNPTMPPFSLIENVNDEQSKHSERRKLFTSVFLTIAQKNLILKCTHAALNEYFLQDMNDCARNRELWYPYQMCRYIFYNNAFYAMFGAHMPKTGMFFFV